MFNFFINKYFLKLIREVGLQKKESVNIDRWNVTVTKTKFGKQEMSDAEFYIWLNELLLDDQLFSTADEKGIIITPYQQKYLVKFNENIYFESSDITEALHWANLAHIVFDVRFSERMSNLSIFMIQVINEKILNKCEKLPNRALIALQKNMIR